MPIASAAPKASWSPRGHACLSARFHVRYFQTRALIPFANYGLGFGEPASSSADSERGFLPTAEGLMAPSMTAAGAGR